MSNTSNTSISADQTSKRPYSRVFDGPILKTFFYYVIPSMLGLIAITTANLVDGAVVGNYLGHNALAAITLLIPYFTLVFATALMLAIGGTVRAGKYIGEGNMAAASAIFSKSIVATLVISSIAAIITTLVKDLLFSVLGASAEVITYMDGYFSIITWVLILQLVTMVLYYFVRADDHPILATTALVTGALINIALDILFIGGLGMGIEGAAYATAIAQSIQIVILSRYFFSPRRTLKLSVKQTHWRELQTSAYNGISEFINELSGGLIILLLNWLLISRLGVDGVAAFTVVNYLIFLSLMMAYGFADALHLLVSQNLGAKKFERIQQFTLTALVSVLIMGALLALALVFANQWVTHIFLDAEQAAIHALAESLITYIWPLFLINSANIILSCYLTAVHQPLPSAIIALSRSLFLPSILLINFYWLMSGWQFLSALPLAEWLTGVLALILCWHYRPSQLSRV